MEEENLGPVVNPDGSPSDVTLGMLGGQAAELKTYLACPERNCNFYVEFTVPPRFWDNYRVTLVQYTDDDDGGMADYHNEDGNHMITVTNRDRPID